VKYVKLFIAGILGICGIMIMIVSAAIAVVGLIGLWGMENPVGGILRYIEEVKGEGRENSLDQYR
jgi:hypothetical protein